MPEFFHHITDLNHPSAIILLSIVGFLLCRIPYLGKWFRGFDTLYHETGHALTAMILGGEAHAIDLHADTSGKTVFSTKGKWRNWFVYAAGYPFSSACGFLLYVCIWSGHSTRGLMITLCIILLNLALWIRNTYGWIWSLVNGFAVVALYYYQLFALQKAFSVLIASWVSLDAFYSCWVLILLNIKKPEGDAGELKKITHIPAVIYAFVFMFFSLCCLAASVALVTGNGTYLLTLTGLS